MQADGQPAPRISSDPPRSLAISPKPPTSQVQLVRRLVGPYSINKVACCWTPVSNEPPELLPVLLLPGECRLRRHSILICIVVETQAFHRPGSLWSRPPQRASDIPLHSRWPPAMDLPRKVLVIYPTTRLPLPSRPVPCVPLFLPLHPTYALLALA